MGKDEQGSLIGVARHQQVLLVPRQLHLRANLVHRGRQSLGVLVARQFFQGFGSRHATFRRFHLRGGSLGVKIKPGGLADHQIARVLIIELGGLLLFFAGLPVVVGVAVNQGLARREAEIIVRERSDDGGNPGKGNSHGGQIDILAVG